MAVTVIGGRFRLVEVVSRQHREGAFTCVLGKKKYRIQQKMLFPINDLARSIVGQGAASIAELRRLKGVQ